MQAEVEHPGGLAELGLGPEPPRAPPASQLPEQLSGGGACRAGLGFESHLLPPPLPAGKPKSSQALPCQVQATLWSQQGAGSVGLVGARVPTPAPAQDGPGIALCLAGGCSAPWLPPSRSGCHSYPHPSISPPRPLRCATRGAGHSLGLLRPAAPVGFPAVGAARGPSRVLLRLSSLAAPGPFCASPLGAPLPHPCSLLPKAGGALCRIPCTVIWG